MIGYHPRDVDLELADPPPVDQIVDAMIEFGNQDQHAGAHCRVIDRPRHAETPADHREIVLHLAQWQRAAAIGMEYAAHEESLVNTVIEDGNFIDIAVACFKKTGDCGDLAGGAG